MTDEQPDDHALALERLKVSDDAYAAQRERERDDLAFQVPERQWDESARQARDPTEIDGVMVPGRPTLSIPKLDQPIQLVLNQARAASLAVNVHPVSEDADDDTAEVMQGLYRQIERDSNAAEVRLWALDRAAKAGFGVYRINTVYDDDSGNPFDQKIVLERILYQDSVALDPSAQKPDWSDGQWAFIRRWMPTEEYQRTYGSKAYADKHGVSKMADRCGDDDSLLALQRDVPDWVRMGGKGRNAVLVVEYFRKEYTAREWVILADGSFAYADEVPAGAELYPGEGTDWKTRTVQVPKVVWSIINGVEEIPGTKQEWNGQYIPLIPVIGRELQPFDSERLFTGMIRPAKDGQKLYNFAASELVATLSAETKSSWIMAEGQDEGYEQMWAQANSRYFPALKYSPVMLNGTMAPPPNRVQGDVSKLAPAMELLHQADDFIQTSTATFDASLGNLPQKDRSGKAILALQQQSDQGNSHYLHQLAQVAMMHEARVVLDLMKAVYDRPGRVAQILDDEDEQSTVMLNQPFVSQDGRPVPAQPGQAKAKHHDLTKGAYGVSVDIGKGWRTRMQHGAEALGQVLTASPEMIPIIGPAYFKFRDEPGMREVAETLKKVRDHQYPFLAQEDGTDDAARLQQENQALKQQLQAMGQQLQQAGQIISTEGVKHQAQVEIAQAQASMQVELQKMKDATTIEIAKINALTKGVIVDRQAENEAVALAAEQRHEVAMAEADHHMARQATDQAQRHDVGMAAVGHQQAMDQQEQAAALAPEPEGQTE